MTEPRLYETDDALPKWVLASVRAMTPEELAQRSLNRVLHDTVSGLIRHLSDGRLTLDEITLTAGAENDRDEWLSRCTITTKPCP